MQITFELDEAQVAGIWSAVFGACGTQYEWWQMLNFEEGAWDKPGKVRLAITDPDDETQVRVRTLNVEQVVRAAIEAARTSVDACTGRPFNPLASEPDFDACVADCVLQTAMLGEVVYS